MLKRVIPVAVFTCLHFPRPVPAAADVGGAVPITYSTDLFHPHGYPDDHYGEILASCLKNLLAKLGR